MSTFRLPDRISPEAENLSRPQSEISHDHDRTDDDGSTRALSRDGTATTQAKVLRPFDVSSLIRKDDAPSPARSPASAARSPPLSSMTSPDVSVGPPLQPSQSSLYPYLLNSGLYHHLMNGSAGFGGPPGGGGGGGPAAFPALNPVLLNAQLALAAHQNPFLASAYASLGGGPLGMVERLKQHRFSPYPDTLAAGVAPPSVVGPPRSQPSFGSDPRSAFQSVVPKAQTSPLGRSSPSSPTCGSPRSSASKSPSTSDIKNIENMVNGLNGSVDGKFGISHSPPRGVSLHQS